MAQKRLKNPLNLSWKVEEDLHLHTTASDGTLTPNELNERLQKSGLKIASITDHDSTEGLDRILELNTNSENSLIVVPGIELSTRYKNSDMHILGIFINHKNAYFKAKIENFAKLRVEGILGTLERLKDIGIEISFDKVKSFAKGTLGRPHIARAMVEKGVVQNFHEAFSKYLADGKPGYIQRKVMTHVEGLNLIHSAGGVGVLAHPRTVNDLEDRLDELYKAGLVGIEVYAERYTKNQQQMYKEMADKYNLIPCGGSDYHANNSTGEIHPGDVGPPPGTAYNLYKRGKVLHKGGVGFTPKGWE